MNGTIELFADDLPAPYQAHSDTSRAAAERIAPHVHTKRGQVLDYLASCGEQGATDEEMQSGISMPANTQRPRRIELVQAGFIRATKLTRRTRSGDFATVWVAVT